MAFISVHMIVKENTRLGLKFLNGCFSSLHEAQYPDEIILCDNGSFKPVFELYREWIGKFKDCGCEVKLFQSDVKDFTGLRNECLNRTNRDATYWHWIDSDEIYYPEDLDVLKNDVIKDRTDIRQVWTYFYHFMIHPWQVQDKCSKDNFFRFTPNVRWYGGVHEHVHPDSLPSGEVVQSGVEYLHYGYVRQQWRTCLKWLHYDWIQHKHLGGYKKENIQNPDGSVTQKDWFRDWRHPNNILWDRNPVCKLYPNSEVATRDYVCQGAEDLVNPQFMFDSSFNELNADNWNNYIEELDGGEFWQKWQDKYKELGNWTDTLDWVLEEMLKCDWNYV